MKKPNDYNDTQGISSWRELPPDGYVCAIMGIAEQTSSSGRPMIKVALDIAEGEYQGYFSDLFESRKSRAKQGDVVKWSNDGTKYIMIFTNEDKCSRDFKSFCEALEASDVKVWSEENDFLINNCKRKKVGVIFGREESEWNGNRSWHTKPKWFTTVENIHEKNYSVPEDKPIPEETFGAFVATDEDIPFM